MWLAPDNLACSEQGVEPDEDDAANAPPPFAELSNFVITIPPTGMIL